MIRALPILVTVVLSLGWAPRARAADGDPDPALQAAKADFEEAQTLFVKERFDDAAAKFLEAYSRKQFPAFLFNAAVALEKSKRYDQAMEQFERYLQIDPEAKDAADVKSRLESLRELTKPKFAAAPDKPAAAKPAPLPALATKGLVIVDSKPDGATIYLDDKKNGVFAHTPWQGSLPPKPVKLIVEAKGYKAEERGIQPRTDKIYEVYIALSQEHFLGWIEVVSNVAGADVFIDRREIGAIGRTPYTGHVKPGKHKLWVQRPGYDVASLDIDVQPGTATMHTVNLEKVGIGWITIAGKQIKGGVLKVDGAVACTTPCQHQVAPGHHRVEVEREGMSPYRGEVDVEKAQDTVVTVQYTPRPPRSKAITAAVVSALFLGGATYVALQGKKIDDDLRKESMDPATQLNTGDHRVQRGKWMYIGADALFGLGALTAVIATWGFLSSGPGSAGEVDQRAVGFEPSLLPGGLGLSASGRF